MARDSIFLQSQITLPLVNIVNMWGRGEVYDKQISEPGESTIAFCLLIISDALLQIP